MKQKQSDVMFLLSILGLLSMSIGFLHSGKKIDQSKPVQHLLIDAIGDMTAQEIRRSLDPLLFSHSIYSAAQALSAASPAILKDFFHDLFAKPNPLTRDEKILLLLLVAQTVKKDIKDRYALYDMLLDYEELQKGQPVLAVAARPEDPAVLKSVLGWMAYRRKKGNYDVLKNWVSTGLRYLVHDSAFEPFKRLFEQRLKVGLDFISLLLVQAIQENRDIRFIPYLISKGVKPNFVGPNKRTLLMEAVLQKNQKAVEELLNLGADPNFIVDPAVGSAIQLAYERGYIDLELLMRRFAENPSTMLRAGPGR